MFHEIQGKIISVWKVWSALQW